MQTTDGRGLGLPSLRALVLAFFVGASLVACCNNNNTSTAPAPQHTIGGTVTGLDGSGLVLTDAVSGNQVTVLANSTAFTITPAINNGSNYAVAVQAQPNRPWQTCVVTNGSGSVGTSDVTSVAVRCTTNTFTVGGHITGLRGSGLVLQDTMSGNRVAVAANATMFVFAPAIASSSGYAVTVAVQPANQSCTVFRSNGVVANAAISNVTVSCVNMARFLFAANLYDTNPNNVLGSVAAFTIDPSNGVLTAAPNSPYAPPTPAAPQTDPLPSALAVDPNGGFLYVANAGSGNVSSYGIAVMGELTHLRTTDTAAAGQINEPVSLAVDPLGLNLVVGTNFNPEGQLVMLSIGSGANAGVLSPATGDITTSTTQNVGNVPFGLVVDPIQSLLFAANLYDATMSGYSIGAGGALTAVAGSPFGFQSGYVNGVPVNQPYGQALHPGGGFLYVTDPVADTVSVYTYGANGVPAFSAKYGVGMNPQGVVVDPTGSFLYVANSGDGTVSAFTINAVNGLLTAVSGSPFTASGLASPDSPTAVSVAMEPSGEYLYFASGDNHDIWAFSIAPATGALTLNGPSVSSVFTAGGPVAIAIE